MFLRCQYDTSGEGRLSSEIVSACGEICFLWQESRTKKKADSGPASAPFGCVGASASARLSVRKCSFYQPKDSTAPDLVEGKNNLLRMRQ
jgi:hypothetical protein